MTTITNFIEGNFVATPSQEVETPFWVLDGPVKQTRQLTQLLIERCQRDKKPLVQVDLGFRTVSSRNQALDKVVGQSGQVYLKTEAKAPYYMLTSSIKQRIKSHFLHQLIDKLQADLKTGPLVKDKQSNSPASCQFALLVQGLEAWQVLNQDKQTCLGDLESFTAALSQLSAKIRQVVVPVESKLLPQEVNFRLERSSTCLTKLLPKDGDTWNVVSTVRRFTGYSKEEEYTITIAQNRAKVIKKKAYEYKHQKTADQVEMLDKLGFKVEKGIETTEENKKMREMIFPHLKKRTLCQAGDKCCGGECKQKPEPVPQNLYILDDEQEDEDDLDV